MNEVQARKAGYAFHGAYSHNKEEMKIRAKEERAKGNKAMVVDIPGSKYSRGSRGMGYAVYFIESETNKAHKKAKLRAIQLHQLRCKLALAEDEVTKLKAMIEKVEGE
jgi:hypothetical protein